MNLGSPSLTKTSPVLAGAGLGEVTVGAGLETVEGLVAETVLVEVGLGPVLVLVVVVVGFGAEEELEVGLVVVEVGFGAEEELEVPDGLLLSVEVA